MTARSFQVYLAQMYSHTILHFSGNLEIQNIKHDLVSFRQNSFFIAASVLEVPIDRIKHFLPEVL